MGNGLRWGDNVFPEINGEPLIPSLRHYCLLIDSSREAVVLKLSWSMAVTASLRTLHVVDYVHDKNRELQRGRITGYLVQN